MNNKLIIRDEINTAANGKKAVFLFVGDKASALMMNVIDEMDIRVVFIDNGCHFDETIEYAGSFGDRIEVVGKSKSVDQSSFAENSCDPDRTGALVAYLNEVEAECLIVPFLREEEGNAIESSYLDGINNISMLKPLYDFTEGDIWRNIKMHGLPYSRLYNKGYRFVDCKCRMTRHGVIQHKGAVSKDDIDNDTVEKLKALGYM